MSAYTIKFEVVDGKQRNEREEIFDKFIERLNTSRAKAGYRPMTPARLAKLIEKVPTKDLYPFYKQCDSARSFGGMFWYKVRPSRAS